MVESLDQMKHQLLTKVKLRENIEAYTKKISELQKSVKSNRNAIDRINGQAERFFLIIGDNVKKFSDPNIEFIGSVTKRQDRFGKIFYYNKFEYGDEILTPSIATETSREIATQCFLDLSGNKMAISVQKNEIPIDLGTFNEYPKNMEKLKRKGNAVLGWVDALSRVDEAAFGGFRQLRMVGRKRTTESSIKTYAIILTKFELVFQQITSPDDPRLSANMDKFIEIIKDLDKRVQEMLHFK